MCMFSNSTPTLRDNKFENILQSMIDYHSVLFVQLINIILNEHTQVMNQIDEDKTRKVFDEFVVDHHNDDELNVQELEEKNRWRLVLKQSSDFDVDEKLSRLFAKNFYQLKNDLIAHANVVYEQDPYVDRNSLSKLWLNRPLNLSIKQIKSSRKKEASMTFNVFLLFIE